MKNEFKHRRPRIGIMLGNYHTDHPIKLVHTVWTLLQNKGIDTQFYLGTESSSFLKRFSMHENKYDYQYATLYHYSHFDDLDVLIICYGTLFLHQKHVEVDTFLATLPNIPVVLLEVDHTPANGCSIITDNYGGIYQLAEHLICEHHLTRIGFVTGPDNNRDSQIRLQAYYAAMRSHSLPVSDSMVAHGDFSENIGPVIEELLDSNPDLQAIMCANDGMAMSAYEICNKRGLTIGKDICITGFDDVELAENMTPPLTTCRQDTLVFSKLAVEAALKILRGETVSSSVIPSPLVIRESCGCTSSPAEKNRSHNIPHVQDHLTESMRMRRDIRSIPWVGALIYREILNNRLSEKSFFESLAKYLIYLGTKSAYVCLADTPIHVSSDDTIQLPKYLLLSMTQQGDTFTAHDNDKAPHVFTDTNDIAMYMDRSGFWFSFILFYDDIHYGIFAVNTEPEQIAFYYMLSLEIGSALRSMYLNIEHLKIQKALSEKKRLLDHLAYYDDLTGLSSRAGIIEKISRIISGKRTSKIAFIMADVDHLKEINDNFGHPEGDWAIKQAAEILKNEFKKGDLLGRIGGDEFVGILHISDPSEAEALINHIKTACDTRNADSDSPYLLTISVGITILPEDTVIDFSVLYHETDKKLYKNKKKRPKSVLRQS